MVGARVDRLISAVGRFGGGTVHCMKTTYRRSSLRIVQCGYNRESNTPRGPEVPVRLYLSIYLSIDIPNPSPTHGSYHLK